MRQQEAAALRAELAAAAAAEAVAAQHQQDMQQLRLQHADQLAQLDAQHTLHLQQQLQEAAAQHNQQLGARLRSQLQQELSSLHEALAELQCQQQEAAACASGAAAGCAQEMSGLASLWQQQLQDARVQLVAVQADAQEVVHLAGTQQAAVQALQQHQAMLAPQGLEALVQEAQEAAAVRCVDAGWRASCNLLGMAGTVSLSLCRNAACTAAERRAKAAHLVAVCMCRADHAAALQQLQETCVQLAALQPTVEQLQQANTDLQAQAAQAALDASAQQQELLQREANLQQQLTKAQAHGSQAQQQLDDAMLELAAAKAEAAAAHSTAEAAEQRMAQAKTGHEAQCCAWEAAYAVVVQQLQQRLLWLCSAYFTPHSGPPAAGSSGGAEDSSSTGCCGLETCPDGLRTDARSSKLQQLSQRWVGADSESLMQLFEHYKAHKQEMLRSAATGGSACSPSTAADTTSSADAPGAGVLLQLQQQALQLEACMLNHMLTLKEALDEEAAAHGRPHQQGTAGTSMLLSAHHLSQHGSSRNPSPSRATIPDRPSTAMSFSSSMTGTSSSRSSSLNIQLLAAMRREKQQLALELKRLQGVERTPLVAAAGVSGTAFPWQRAAGSNQSTPRAINSCRHWGVAEGSSTATAMHLGQDAVSTAGDGVGAGQGILVSSVSSPRGLNLPPAGSEPQAGRWEEVDEVLQLLQGCQLGLPAPHAQQGYLATSSGAAEGPSSSSPCSCPHTAASSWQGQGQASAAGGGSRQAGRLQWRQQDSLSSRSPTRTVSWGHAGKQQAASPGTVPGLRKATSCGVQRGVAPVAGASSQAHGRGIAV